MLLSFYVAQNYQIRWNIIWRFQPCFLADIVFRTFSFYPFCYSDFAMHAILHYLGFVWWEMVTSGITVILTEFLKIITNRARPRKQSIADRSLPIRDDVSNPAFPSGDSAQVFQFSFLTNRLLLLLVVATYALTVLCFYSFLVWQCTDECILEHIGLETQLQVA